MAHKRETYICAIPLNLTLNLNLTLIYDFTYINR